MRLLSGEVVPAIAVSVDSELLFALDDHRMGILSDYLTREYGGLVSRSHGPESFWRHVSVLGRPPDVDLRDDQQHKSGDAEREQRKRHFARGCQLNRSIHVMTIKND